VSAFIFIVYLLAIGAAFGADGAAPVAAAGDCTTNPALDAEEQQLLTLINNHRAQNGRTPLVASYKLSKAGQWKSQDMGAKGYFAHDDQSRTWVQRLRDCGYGYNTWLGENIVAGVSTAQAAFDAWKNSAGHNANMLGANYTAIGIGRANVPGSPYGWYWTTEFGGVDDGWASAQLPAPTPTSSPAPTVGDGSAPKVTVKLQSSRNRTTAVASAQDTDGIDRVEFYVNGALVKTDRRGPYVAVVRHRPGATLRVVAIDRTGARAQTEVALR
jgi:uncharacterized protein YkwD